MSVLEDSAQREEEAFELYAQKYAQMLPPPEPPGIRGQGWKFYILLLTSIASVLLAALRTADQFYKAASLGGNPTLGYIEAGLVIFAIEFGLVAYSAVRASERKTASTPKLGLAIALMVIVSMFAGLGQSLNLIDSIDPTFLRYFQYGLSFVIGVGATAIAWIGGDVLGGQIAVTGIENGKAKEAYEKDKEAWFRQVRSSYAGSAERKIARQGLMLELDRSLDERTTNRQNEQRTRPYLPNEGSHEKAELIIKHVENVFVRDGRIPTGREVSKALGVSVGYAHDTIKKWEQENSARL